jgi:branched-chain amino acid transport system permease protein
MLVGVPVHRVSTIVFGIGVAVTAAGGMIFGATNAFNGDSGADLISRLLTIVVLGGLGSMGGALVGAIVLLVVENLVAVLWSPDWAPLVFSVVLVVVLLVRPNGLLGRAVAT